MTAVRCPRGCGPTRSPLAELRGHRSDVAWHATERGHDSWCVACGHTWQEWASVEPKPLIVGRHAYRFDQRAHVHRLVGDVVEIIDGRFVRVRSHLGARRITTWDVADLVPERPKRFRDLDVPVEPKWDWRLARWKSHSEGTSSRSGIAHAFREGRATAQCNSWLVPAGDAGDDATYCATCSDQVEMVTATWKRKAAAAVTVPA